MNKNLNKVMEINFNASTHMSFINVAFDHNLL